VTRFYFSPALLVMFLIAAPWAREQVDEAPGEPTGLLPDEAGAADAIWSSRYPVPTRAALTAVAPAGVIAPSGSGVEGRCRVVE